MSDLMLFCGSASTDLTNEVAELLGVNVGRATTSVFSDGETKVEILDNVRGRDIFIIQSTCAPTNDNIME